MVCVYSIKNLKRRSARSALLIIGVSLAITLTTIMFAISEGINSSTKELIDETRIELFVYPESSNPILQEFTRYLDLNDGRELAAKIKESHPSIRAASPWLAEGLYVATNKLENQSEFTSESEEIPKIFSITGKGHVPELEGDFGGIEQISGTDLPTKNDPFYANGTYSGGTDSDNFTHEVVLNKFLAELLDISVGDVIFVSGLGPPIMLNNETYSYWLENSTWFKVNGIILETYEPPSLLSATMHLSELQYLTGKHRFVIFNNVLKDFVNEIYVDLYDPADKKVVKNWLETEFEDKDKITVLTSDELTGEFNSFLDIFEGFSTMILIITTFVVILFVSTIMMISVQEQGKEIGMLRAIGISKSTIVKNILAESIMICLIGFIAGALLGIIGSSLLEDFIRSTEQEIPVGIEITTITPGLVLTVSFITIIIGILASIIPAIWASRLVPVESIRKV